jgi:hypothetical protein
MFWDPKREPGINMDSEAKGILLIGGIIVLAVIIAIYISIQGSGSGGHGLFKFINGPSLTLLGARIHKTWKSLAAANNCQKIMEKSCRLVFLKAFEIQKVVRIPICSS